MGASTTLVFCFTVDNYHFQAVLLQYQRQHGRVTSTNWTARRNVILEVAQFLQVCQLVEFLLDSKCIVEITSDIFEKLSRY